MIPALNGVYYRRGFWYVHAYLHCDAKLFRRPGGADSSAWEELTQDGEWEDTLFEEECEELLREFTSA